MTSEELTRFDCTLRKCTKRQSWLKRDERVKIINDRGIHSKPFVKSFGGPFGEGVPQGQTTARNGWYTHGHKA